MTDTAALPETVVKRLAWLELSDVQQRFRRGPGQGSSYSSHRVACHVGLEYRRFLLLRLMHPQTDIPAPPIIDAYWRLHAADRPAFAADCAALTAGTALSADRLVPAPGPTGGPAGPAIRELYEETFTCGNADLWGWPQLSPGHRTSAPGIGSIHLRLPCAVDDLTRTRLRTEALERRDTAMATQHIAERKRFATPGQVLHDLHWKSTISRLIAAQTGAIVVPTAVGYLYYGSGDFIGIHTDGYGGELTLLTLLSGPVEPLHCHLHLADAPPDEIRTLAEISGGLPQGGTPFDINTVPFLLSGQRIPHQRNPMDRSEETVVLVQSYAGLIP